MSCCMTIQSGLASSSSSTSRIPSFVFASGTTTINRSAVTYHRRPTTFGGLKFGSQAIKTAVSSRKIGCFAALSPELKTTLDKVVTSHKVILFMKGTKDFPQCGFSNTVVSILKAVNVPFETVNILENEFLRQGLKEYSQWPTFPQLYIDGEFFGGCDITVDAYKSGELQELLEKASLS
ncbi:uncharacterized protein LOC143585580 [Bidens hawaiensis]|uniref:uncharacterized protein LOC143585580 n=1 Tax=Bidens hawaiensis TaxID=980011 RepID=UPI0040497A67